MEQMLTWRLIARVFRTWIQDGVGLWWLQHSKHPCGSNHAGGAWSDKSRWAEALVIYAVSLTLPLSGHCKDCAAAGTVPAREWGAAAQELKRWRSSQHTPGGIKSKGAGGELIKEGELWPAAGVCVHTTACEELTSNTDHSRRAQKEKKLCLGSSWALCSFLMKSCPIPAVYKLDLNSWHFEYFLLAGPSKGAAQQGISL